MLTHKGTQTIETTRLTLRRFSIDDADAMYRNWASDPEVTKYLSWPTHTDISVSRTVTSDWENNYDKPAYYQWAIVYKPLGEPIGCISAVHVDERVEAVEIGYCIGRTWWHMGVMTEALTAVTDFFFAEVGVNRVAARHDAENLRSGMVMRRCGMTCEGTLRASLWNNRGICDCVHYSILRDEWEKRRSSR